MDENEEFLLNFNKWVFQSRKILRSFDENADGEFILNVLCMCIACVAVDQSLHHNTKQFTSLVRQLIKFFIENFEFSEDDDIERAVKEQLYSSRKIL